MWLEARTAHQDGPPTCSRLQAIAWQSNAQAERASSSIGCVLITPRLTHTRMYAQMGGERGQLLVGGGCGDCASTASTSSPKHPWHALTFPQTL